MMGTPAVTKEWRYVLDYMPLAYSIARKFNATMRAMRIEYADAEAEAMLALVLAEAAYDESRGRFYKYATVFIRNHLIDVVKAESLQKNNNDSLELLSDPVLETVANDGQDNNKRAAILKDRYSFEFLSIEHLETYGEFLASLNEEQRFLLALQYWHEEKTQKDYSMIMQKKFGHSFCQATISNMLASMKRQLKKSLYTNEKSMVYSI